MKYALLTTAMLALSAPALAQAPGTPEYTAHEAVIRDCLIAKAGGHDAFAHTTSTIPLHPTLRAVKPTDPSAPKFQTDWGNRMPKPPPSAVGKDAAVSDADLRKEVELRKFAAQCRHENP